MLLELLIDGGQVGLVPQAVLVLSVTTQLLQAAAVKPSFHWWPLLVLAWCPKQFATRVLSLKRMFATCQRKQIGQGLSTNSRKACRQ